MENEIFKPEFESNGTLSEALSNDLPPVEILCKENDEENIRIEPETIFIWIDILGFSSLVEDESKYSGLLDLLNDFYNEFKLLNKSADCKRISDGIILKLKPSIQNCSDIKDFFDDVMKVQNKFLLRNKFLRGGIALGSKFNIQDVKSEGNANLQENEEFYISNGLARAYNLESGSISWPIIGTNVDHLNKMCKKYGKEIKKNFERTYSEKGEKIYYLNSYKFLKEFELKQIYKSILKNISEYKKKPHVQQKYIWIQSALEKKCKKLPSLRCPKCGDFSHA